METRPEASPGNTILVWHKMSLVKGLGSLLLPSGGRAQGQSFVKKDLEVNYEPKRCESKMCVRENEICVIGTGSVAV
jgi:hypothetical protein